MFLLVTALWIVWTCDFCFFLWFSHGKNADCKKTTGQTYSNKFGISFYFCVLDIFHFPFELRHTKTIENIMKNEQNKKNEQKLEPCYEKSAQQSWSYTHENQEPWNLNWSHVHKKKSSRARDSHFHDRFRVFVRSFSFMAYRFRSSM